MANPGDLDTTFGSGGKVTTAFGIDYAYGASVAIDSNGKIVLGGTVYGDNPQAFALAKYTTTGALDTTFGPDNNGKVTTLFGSDNVNGNSIAVDVDNKIVIGGVDLTSNPQSFALARYNTDGTLDTSFGTGGKVITTFGFDNVTGNSIYIDVNGKIVLGGTEITGQQTFALARYNTNGTLDTSFGTGGKVTTLFGTDNVNGYSVAVASDGRIVVGGTDITANPQTFALARYNNFGILDNTFGTNGLVTTPFTANANGNSVVIYPNGKIVLGGTEITGQQTFALARYNFNGSLDSSFGSGGKVTTAFGSDNVNGSSVVIATDGKIVLAGSEITGQQTFALARYNYDGSLDTSFGSGGKVTTAFGSDNVNGSSVVIDKDNKIVVAGSEITGQVTFALARYIGYAIITCFKEDTKILTNLGYTPIQHLRKGDLVKTSRNGFKAIDAIGKKDIHHPALQNRIKDQLYKCTSDKYPEVFEDLVITGCHSILVDNFDSQSVREKAIQVNGAAYVTDRKYRLPACVDERATVYEKPGNYTIYHFALENDDYYMNYGVYANGLLVETCSKRYLKELANMELIE